jgi:hypothetical protein
MEKQYRREEGGGRWEEGWEEGGGREREVRGGRYEGRRGVERRRQRQRKEGHKKKRQKYETAK